MTWVSAEVGEGSVSYSLIEIPVAPVLVGLGLAAIVAGAVAAWMGWPGGLIVAGLTASAIAVVSGAFLVLGEWIASLSLGSGLGVTTRRFALGAGVGPGAVVAFGTALAIAAATLTPLRERLAAPAAALRGRGGLVLPALVLLATALVLLVHLREGTWLVLEALGARAETSGADLVLVNLLSGAAVWLLALAILTVCFGQLRAGALLAAAAGWLMTFITALTIALPEGVGRSVAGVGHAAAAAWLTHFLGYGVALAAAALLWSEGSRA